MVIFSGSSNTKLAKDVAELMGAVYSPVDSSKFSNDELRVKVAETRVNSRAVVVQSLSNPVDSNIFEFCMICDAIRRMGVADITAVIPWMAYSKQDKVFRKGEALSVKVLARILQSAHVSQILTFDLHNPAILGFFDIPVENLTARPMFVEYFRKKMTPYTVVVAPDAGSIKSSTSFAGELGVPVVYMDKKRDLSTGEVTIMGISRPVEKADVIIVDDMIVTGSTLIESAKYLHSQRVKSMRVAATHHLRVEGATKAILEAGFDEIVVTDTISQRTHDTQLTVLTVAPIIEQELAESSEL